MSTQPGPASSTPPRPTSTAEPRTTSTPTPRTTTTTTPRTTTTSTTPRTTSTTPRTTSTTPRTTSTTSTTSRTTSTTSTAPRTTSTTSTAPRTTSTTSTAPRTTSTTSRTTSSTSRTTSSTSRTTSSTSKTTSSTSRRRSSTTIYPPQPPITVSPPPPGPGTTWEPPVVTITATPPSNQNEVSPEPTLSTTSTSIYTTLWVSTSPDGALYTTTIRATIVIVPSPTPSSSSSSHGALIGGIAGGVVGLIFILIGFLYWFRNRLRGASGVNSERGTSSAQYEGHLTPAGAEITQFQYDPGVGGTMSMSGGTMSAGPHSPTFSGSSMQQYRDSQALLGGYAPDGGGPLTATSGSHYEPTSSDPEGYSTFPSSRMHHGSPRAAGFEPGASRVQDLHTKETEALRQRRGLVLASAPEGEEVVVQHMDGGQVPGAVPPPRTREIPPRYDSIPTQ